MEMTRFVMEDHKDSATSNARTKPHDRLRKARLDAGYRSASEAARRLGMKPVTYIAHENGGRGFDPQQAEVYARKFKVSATWLLYGTEETRLIQAAYGAPSGSSAPAKISNDATLEKDSEKSAWQIPEDFFERRLRVPTNNADIVIVLNETMVDRSNPHAANTVYPGDRVIIDTRDQFPEPPGVFVVRERTRSELSVRKLRLSHFPDIDVIEVSGNNRDYPTYEIGRDELTIYGRVKGRMTSI